MFEVRQGGGRAGGVAGSAEFFHADGGGARLGRAEIADRPLDRVGGPAQADGVAAGGGGAGVVQPRRRVGQKHDRQLTQQFLVAADAGQRDLGVEDGRRTYRLGHGVILPFAWRRLRSRPVAAGQIRQGLVQVVESDGFGEVAVHAGFEAALAVALHGVGRQRDDRQTACGVRVAGKLRREELRGDCPGGRGDDSALHCIFKLTDVAWPLVVHKDSQRLRGECALFHAVLLCVEPKEVRGQKGNIFAAGAEWRQLQVNDVEAVE